MTRNQRVVVNVTSNDPGNKKKVTAGSSPGNTTVVEK